MMKRAVAGLMCVGFLTACGDDSQPADGTGGNGGTGGEGAAGGEGGEGQIGIAALGAGQHTADSVDILVVSQPTDPLTTPRDLAFNPQVPGQLWVANRADSSMTVYENFGTEGQITTRYASSGNTHFMVQPSSLAFSDAGWFATIHETDQKTQGPDGTPADFMGPSLWTTDLTVFDGGHGGHYDMLHNSPNGMGIAWESGNAYWVFDGYHSSLTRYDFVTDHGPGGADHSDGIVSRYVEGAVIRRADVPSHMEYDPATGYLYVADTGNNRVVILDTATGTKGQAVGPNYDGTDQHRVDGASLWPVVDGATQGMTAPSGLAIANGVLYVSCFDTSKIYGFSMEGELIDYLETGIPGGQMMGLEVDAEGNLYTLNATMNQVIRISPKAAPEG